MYPQSSVHDPNYQTSITKTSVISPKIHPTQNGVQHSLTTVLSLGNHNRTDAKNSRLLMNDKEGG